MIGELSELLRASLRESSRQEVPLRIEVQTLQHYLEIMKARFGDRLQIQASVPSETADVLVPSFILQPLVENAIKHGVGTLEEGGTITVDARREADRLIVQVRDTGKGFPDSAADLPNHRGLAAVRERLRLLYGQAGTMTLANGSGGGATVTLTLPWRTGPPDGEAGGEDRSTP